jgi:ABC-type phosphate transport system ATPase subunit
MPVVPPSSVDVSRIELTGLTLADFRCFESVSLDSLGKVNLIVGPNNIGKSALLRALRRMTRIDLRYVPKVGTPDGVGFLGGSHSVQVPKLDWRDESHHPTIIFNLKIHSEDTIRERKLQWQMGSIRWFAEEGESPTTGTPRVHRRSESNDPVAIASLAALAARIVYVPSRRGIANTLERHDPTTYEERIYDGHDLLVDVTESMLPKIATEHIRERRANTIKDFAAKILGAQVEIWPDLEHRTILIQIRDDQPRRPSDLGEGVSQALIIAGALTSVENPILLLEDPEMGLHPLLQRNLIDLLATTPNVQAFVTTHSNHILDTIRPEITFFRLRSSGQGRVAERLATADIGSLSDLGVRPSSLMAANCIIWVEGPSDAIYIRFWISRMSTDIHEWHDYSFSFFGGALLHHVGVDDSALLVRLMRINPSFFLVADSDRSCQGDPLGKAYLQRFIEGLEQSQQSRVWITDDREVESYIPDEVLRRAVGRKVSEASSGCASDLGSTLEDRLTQLGLPKSCAEKKVDLAAKVVEYWQTQPTAFSTNLESRIEHLLAFIRACRSAVPA